MAELEWWSAYTNVIVSEDQLHAFLSISTSVPSGVQPSSSDCLQWLAEHHVVVGVSKSVIEQLVASPEAFSGRMIEVATGVPAKPGRDAEFQFYLAEEGPVQPPVLPNGRVDLFHVTNIRSVKAGALLVKKLPAQSGTDGTSVYGNFIKAPSPRDVRLPNGKNVVVSDDGYSLFAGMDGHVVYQPRDHQLHVYSDFTVPGDIDFKVGNIQFVGNVTIAGHVLDGFRVEAEGDIEIHGHVGAASIIAGGNVTIHGGFQARGKGIVRAGGTIRTKFIQNSTVHAGWDCIVEDSIMHSEVSANHQVRIEGRKGVLVGGVTRAGDSVNTKHLGSPMFTSTEIEVGVRPDLREEQLRCHQVGLELEQKREKTQKAIELLDQFKKLGKVLPPDKEQLRESLEQTLRMILQEDKQLKELRTDIEQQIVLTKQATVSVEDTLYAGVKLTLNSLVHYIREPRQHVQYGIDAGDIYCRPLPERKVGV